MIYHEESKEEHIEKIAWSNHVISWKNGEKTFRAILLTAVTSSGNIVLYRVKQVFVVVSSFYHFIKTNHLLLLRVITCGLH